MMEARLIYVCFTEEIKKRKVNFNKFGIVFMIGYFWYFALEASVVALTYIVQYESFEITFGIEYA
jgi:hypothetical protein